jgi:TRAP transporter TAXI family solute receptor
VSALVLTLGTATPGGGFPAYGEAFATAIRTVAPSLELRAQHSKGSLENVSLLKEGAIDLGLVAGETATAALAGDAGLTILTAMYATPGMFALRGDAPEADIAALRGKRIAWGAKGSGFIVLARQIMAGLGLDLERDFEAVFLDRAGDGPAMVLEGRVAALWGGGAGWPGFAAIARGPAGIRFVAPSVAECAQILSRDPALRAMELPARSYPGQGEAVPSVGTWSYVLARPGLDPEVGYRLAKALHGARAGLAALLPQGAETTGANTVAAAGRVEQIHVGVRRFLQEAGLLSPPAG